MRRDGGARAPPEPHPILILCRQFPAQPGSSPDRAEASLGDFAGFRLVTEHSQRRRFRAREAEVERLVLEAWRDRWVVELISSADNRDRDDPPLAQAIILLRTGHGSDR